MQRQTYRHEGIALITVTRLRSGVGTMCLWFHTVREQRTRGRWEASELS
jgi:hypothetical protein